MAKNILLVLPKVPASMEMWNIPPIGMLYISSALKEGGLNVYNLNLMLEENTKEAIENIILKNNIDIIATGDLVLNYKAVQEVVDIAKNLKPDIITIIGGGLVTHSPKEAMKIISNADYGIIGEGEITVKELINSLASNLDISCVKGIIYKIKDDFVITDEREDIEYIDNIKMPDYDGFKYFDFAKKFSTDGNISALLTTSRSCPFKCTFCSSSGGKKYRQRSLDNIFEELEYLVENYNVTQIYLNDELFAVDSDRVYEFCNRVKKYNIKWLVYLRISKYIKLDLLKLMNESGCICVFYGLESADNKILKSMNKGTTIEEIKRVLEITKEAGVKIKGNFIFGDTKETKETLDNTFNWIEKNAHLLENISITPIKLFPGSILYYRAIENNKIKDTVDFIRKGCPLINTSDFLTDEEYNYLVYGMIPSFAVKLHDYTSSTYKEALKEKLKINFENKMYLYEFTCNKCNKVNKKDLFPAMIVQSGIICSKCKEKHEMFFSSLFFKTFEMEITDIIKKNKLGLWGSGETLEYLYKFNNFLQNSNIIIIDSDKNKQEIGFHNKRIYKPEDIDRLNIDTIIFCVGSMNYGVLSKHIRNKYQKVNEIKWIYSVFFD